MNVLRIAPHSAMYVHRSHAFTPVADRSLPVQSQFATFEFLSSLTPPSTASRLASGAAAGMLAVVMTYPLDLIRSRLSISGAKLRAGGSLVELGKGVSFYAARASSNCADGLVDCFRRSPT